MLLSVPVYIRAYEPKAVIFLLKSSLGFHSTIVDGLSVFDIPFFDEKAFIMSMMPSISDLTINIVMRL